MIKNRLCQLGVLLFSGLVFSCQPNSTNKKKPNIIFILADDFGYMDTQSYAEHILGTPKDSMFYETPNLDRLISEGIAFEQAYANQLCSPTRASLLTGKYPAKLGFTTATPKRKTYYNQNMPTPTGSYAHDVIYHADKIKIEQAWINGSSNTALPSGTPYDKGWDETTIAEALTGYHSAFIGKWHVGGHGAKGYTPGDQGFEPIAWYDAGGSTYFNWINIWNNGSKQHFPDAPQDKMYTGNAGTPSGMKHLTDDLTEQALKYIDERSTVKEEPFFLYFCHFSVHTPWQSKKDERDYFNGKETKGWNNHKDATYAGMISTLDKSVGKILDKLEETGLEENTLVVFMSDNGGIDSRITPNKRVTSNYPLMGGKACVTEGGIRVPLVFRWKGKLDDKKWCSIPVDCNDIFPTLVQAAGYDLQPHYNNGIDGQSLYGLLSDLDNKKNTYTRDTRYWHYPFNVIYNNPYDSLPLTPHSAIRKGDYKLIYDWHGRLKLFNIKEDISETNNLAKKMPEKTNKLFANLITWLEAHVKETYWPKVNPDYNPENEAHKTPFVNLYDAYKNGGNIAEICN